MYKLIATIKGRFYIYIYELPLFGHIAFGIVDRGTNVLQTRITTICPYNCIYCSVDAGPESKHRLSEFIVDSNLIVEWFKKAYEQKDGDVIEALLDGVGEPATHPHVVEIISSLKKIVPRVAMESRGYNLTKKLVDKLSEAGLDRVNISIDTLNEEKGKIIQGVPWYSTERVKSIIEYIIKETDIDVHLTPVWLPGLNDQDIIDIIEWGLKIGVGKRFPPFGIQKYEVHKYGRRIKGAREVSWDAFKSYLEKLEEKFNIQLYYKKLDFGIRKAKRIPMYFRKNERINVTLVSPGWLINEVLAVDEEYKSVITVVGINWSNKLIGKRIKVRIIQNDNGIYLAKV